MAEENDSPIDALAISRLGAAFQRRLEEKSADQAVELALRDEDLSLLRAEHDQTLQELLERAQEVAQLRDERDALAAEIERQGSEVRRLQAVNEEQIELRNAANTQFERERERLKLVHQSQVEALFARHREAEAALREKILLSETRMGNLENALAIKAEQLRSAELTATAARQANERIESLKRNARAREAMFRESAEDARIKGHLDVMREQSRAAQLAVRVATLGEALKSLPARLGEDAQAIARLFAGEVPVDCAQDESVEAAMAWLADHGESVLADEKSLTFEVSAGATWSDKTFIEAAYRWLLGREVDIHGLQHYRERLQTRMSRGGMLLDLARSAEALSRLRDGAAVRGVNDHSFVEAAYRAVLGRAADTGGLEHYLARMNAGTSRALVLRDLSNSREARSAKTITGSALRVIEQSNHPKSKLRRMFRIYMPGSASAEKQIWLVGRLAAIDGSATRERAIFAKRLDHFSDEIERRVVAAHSAALAASEPSAPTSGRETETQARDHFSVKTDFLADCSGERNVGQIIDLIRSELRELGLA